jgi:hypothetical protein
MEFLKALGIVIFIFITGYFISRRKALEDEFKRNDLVDPPSRRQLRWDLRHIREDIHMLVLINLLIFWMIAAALFLKH